MGIITGSVMYFMGAVLGITASIFSAVTYRIPVQITSAIYWAFGHFVYLRGIFPVDTLFACIGTIALVWGYMYGLKIFMHTIYPIIPWIGSKIHLPHSSQK